MIINEAYTSGTSPGIRGDRQDILFGIVLSKSGRVGMSPAALDRIRTQAAWIFLIAAHSRIMSPDGRMTVSYMPDTVNDGGCETSTDTVWLAGDYTDVRDSIDPDADAFVITAAHVSVTPLQSPASIYYMRRVLRMCDWLSYNDTVFCGPSAGKKDVIIKPSQRKRLPDSLTGPNIAAVAADSILRHADIAPADNVPELTAAADMLCAALRKADGRLSHSRVYTKEDGFPETVSADGYRMRKPVRIAAVQGYMDASTKHLDSQSVSPLPPSAECRICAVWCHTSAYDAWYVYLLTGVERDGDALVYTADEISGGYTQDTVIRQHLADALGFGKRSPELSKIYGTIYTDCIRY